MAGAPEVTKYREIETCEVTVSTKPPNQCQQSDTPVSPWSWRLGHVCELCLVHIEKIIGILMDDRGVPRAAGDCEGFSRYARLWEDGPGRYPQFDRGICYLYLAYDQSHERATGASHGHVRRGPDEERLAANLQSTRTCRFHFRRWRADQQARRTAKPSRSPSRST